MGFLGNGYRAVRDEILVVGVVCFAGLLAHGQDRNPGGNPGLDPVDPFTADGSPRALAFKKAWRHAIEEGARLEPLPKGVTGEEQRRRVVESYERAIKIMPEAPPCASFLERIGRIWNGWFGEAREKPDKAIGAYRRVIKEYPDAHEFVIKAWGGIAYSEFLKKDYTAAVAAVKEVLKYQLPDDAKPELLEFAERYKKGARRALGMYSAAAKRHTQGLKKPAAVPTDRDSDGLEDALERKIGTNPRAADTDGDGLSDYEEHCKYRTNPARKDSDGDGKPDGDWGERREHTYTIRAICRLRPPASVQGMNDLYQDARRLKKSSSLKDATVVEVLLFPFSAPHVFAQRYPKKALPKPLQQYVQPTLCMNFSSETQRKVRAIVKDAGTDVVAVEKMLKWIATETKLVRYPPHWDFFRVVSNKIVWHRHVGGAGEDRRFLETNFYGGSMFKNKVHGTCSSMAILRGTTFRAAGLPARLIQTFPLMGRCEKDPKPLVDRLRMRAAAKGVEWPPGANHMYNEVFLNSHWIRVDQSVNVGPFVGDKLFVRVYSAASWNNWVPFRSKKEALYEGRQFRALDVSDLYPKYKSRITVDIAVGNTDLRVTKSGDGRPMAVIAIRNNGTWRSPVLDVYFYAGDPDKGGRLMGRHRAGPIMPRVVWREGHHLKLREGEKAVFVVVDPQNRVPETDESNNRASMVIPRARRNGD